MTASWLHVSDFHFKSGDPYDRDVVLRALVRSVAEFRRSGRQPDLIFATGDVAHSGQESEYQAAAVFFDALCAAAGVDKRRLYVIPGNHDIDRALGVGLARTIGAREEADTYFGPSAPSPTSPKNSVPSRNGTMNILTAFGHSLRPRPVGQWMLSKSEGSRLASCQ